MEIKLGLGRMQQLLALLGDPQDRIPAIQVAGTNGKGSVTSCLERILTSAGYRTGRYTSPAVFTVNEQYMACGREITDRELEETNAKIDRICCRMKEEGMDEPSAFERETAAAFVWFAEMNCEYMVLETGLGGDLDATNIVRNTICSVLTPIGLEHKRFLGNTIEEIAGHKAGIIKKGAAVVYGCQEEEARRVIEKRAALSGCPVYRAESCRVTKEAETVCFSYRGMELESRQTASWQLQNTLTALEAVIALRDRGLVIPGEAVRKGLLTLSWRGRFERHRICRAGKNLQLLLDGAHNPDGASALRMALDEKAGESRKLFVTGVLADKDYVTIIKTLFFDAEAVYTIESDSPRALPAEAYAEAVSACFPKTEVKAFSGMEEALTAAVKRADDNDWIVVCGSLSFMREIDRILKTEFSETAE